MRASKARAVASQSVHAAGMSEREPSGRVTSNSRTPRLRMLRRARLDGEHHRDLQALGGLQLKRCGRCHNGDRGCTRVDGFEICNRPQQLSAMAERCNTDLFEVLIGQVTQDREINIVLGKALGVLGQAELFEPVRDQLHRDHSPRIYRGLATLLDESSRKFIGKIARVVHRLTSPKAIHHSQIDEADHRHSRLLRAPPKLLFAPQQNRPLISEMGQTRIHHFQAYVSFHQLRTCRRIGSGPLRAISGCEQMQQVVPLRGRDASYLAPPAQIRTCGFPAYGSHLGYRRQ
jgi:hypothetical protein